MAEQKLVKEYWRRMKVRSLHKESGQKDLRPNAAYREWLAANELPAEPFDPARYRAWKRGKDRWSL